MRGLIQMSSPLKKHMGRLGSAYAGRAWLTGTQLQQDIRCGKWKYSYTRTKRQWGFSPCTEKALQFEVNTHCSGIHTCGSMCRALTLFSQSLLLQLTEGYFWQSLSCPFACTLSLTAAVIVPALSNYLGRAWRNQTPELYTQVACNPSLFKCNYASSVVFLCFALCAVRSGVFILCRARHPSEALIPAKLKWLT